MPKPKPKKKPTKQTKKPKPGRAKKKVPVQYADSFREAARMVELCATEESEQLLRRGKGVVPLQLLMGTRLFSPAEVWRGFRRPTEPTSEVCAIVSYLIRHGMTADAATRAIGITNPEFLTWIDRGVRDIQAGLDTPHANFVRIADMADAQDEMRGILGIAEAQHNWQALAWIRERKNKQRWGKAGGITTVVNIAGATPEQDAETLIPDTAEVLLYLEEAGYTVPRAENAETETVTD